MALGLKDGCQDEADALRRSISEVKAPHQLLALLLIAVHMVEAGCGLGELLQECLGILPQSVCNVNDPWASWPPLALAVGGARAVE